MPPQVSKDMFARALSELGHNPKEFEGKRLSLMAMSDLYDLDQDIILEAIDRQQLSAHYDYVRDTIWIDALEAAHFFYCARSEGPLYSAS